MKSQIDSGTQWDVWSAAIYLYHHGVAHMKRSSSPSLSRCLVDSATAVEKEVARADDGSACPGCRTHGQARRHAALAVAKRGRVALGPGRSPSARVGDMREKSDPLVTLLSHLFTQRASPKHSTSERKRISHWQEPRVTRGGSQCLGRCEMDHPERNAHSSCV